LSVCHIRAPGLKRWTDLDAIWYETETARQRDNEKDEQDT